MVRRYGKHDGDGDRKDILRQSEHDCDPKRIAIALAPEKGGEIVEAGEMHRSAERIGEQKRLRQSSNGRDEKEE